MKVNMKGLLTHMVNDWNNLIDFIEENTNRHHITPVEVSIIDVDRFEKLLNELRQEISMLSCLEPEKGEPYLPDNLEVKDWSILKDD